MRLATASTVTATVRMIKNHQSGILAALAAVLALGTWFYLDPMATPVHASAVPADTVPSVPRHSEIPETAEPAEVSAPQEHLAALPEQEPEAVHETAPQINYSGVILSEDEKAYNRMITREKREAHIRGNIEYKLARRQWERDIANARRSGNATKLQQLQEDPPRKENYPES